MTKKDYIAIAAILRKLGEQGAHCFDNSLDRLNIAHHFADILQRDNARFDRRRFMAASLPTTD